MKQIKPLENQSGKAERAYVYCGFSQPDHYILGQAARQKTPPYNTGKVKIGAAYTPPPLRTYSSSEELLQQALLAERQAHQNQQETWFMWAVAGIGLIGAVIILLTV